MGKSNIIDTVLISIATMYSLANIKEFLGITILIIQFIWIIAKIIDKLYRTVKARKSLDEVDKDIENLTDFLEKMIGDENDTTNKPKWVDIW